jgi:hypothetical protein
MDSLEAFGAFLMRRVRDKAILDWDQIVDGVDARPLTR